MSWLKLSSTGRWLGGTLASLYLVPGCLKGVCVLCKWSEVSFKVDFWLWQRQLRSALGLLDYLFSFHHYTTDLWVSPVWRWVQKTMYNQLVSLEESEQASLKEKWKWEETWPFWSPHGVEEWDLAGCFRNTRQDFAGNLVVRSKDCCSFCPAWYADGGGEGAVLFEKCMSYN